MRASTRSYWSSVIDHSISYLVTLKDVNGLSLLKHRRSTFVKGMVIAAKSARKLADDLLYRTEDPYSYVLNYKWSQDHAELLNASIRGLTGDNTNPNVQQFKSALKKILLHAALSASKYSNCVTFDNDDSPPIFALKWTKNRSTVSTKETADENYDIDIEILDRPFVISQNLENALAYVAGSIVRRMSTAIDCSVCCNAMITTDRNKRHLSLISIKDNGGLVYPSDDIMTIIRTERCDRMEWLLLKPLTNFF